jgi:hypothetical protein
MSDRPVDEVTAGSAVVAHDEHDLLRCAGNPSRAERRREISTVARVRARDGGAGIEVTAQVDGRSRRAVWLRRATATRRSENRDQKDDSLPPHGGIISRGLTPRARMIVAA